MEMVEGVVRVSLRSVVFVDTCLLFVDGLWIFVVVC